MNPLKLPYRALVCSERVHQVSHCHVHCDSGRVYMLQCEHFNRLIWRHLCLRLCVGVSVLTYVLGGFQKNPF